MPKVAVIKFPGTNADLDVVWVLRNVSGLEARSIWYADFNVKGWDAVVIPGGFSYGDWLRAGAIAARSDVISELIKALDNGTPILGICNGFQILTEAGLLPGALLPNESCRFICRWVKVVFTNPRGPWLKLASDGLIVDMPIAHGEGRYYVESTSYQEKISKLPTIKYYGYNPNGSLYDIAGIGSEDGLVVGLMPHPERASEPELTPRKLSCGGRVIWLSIAKSLKEGW
ncbi:MAG: phosphoribosylformylglycinamidine synthase subunit PurQ [Sulfolobales archaeon]